MENRFELRCPVSVQKVYLTGALAYNNQDQIWLAIWLHLSHQPTPITAHSLRQDLFPRLPLRACRALLCELERQKRLLWIAENEPEGWVAWPHALEDLGPNDQAFWQPLPDNLALRLEVAQIALPDGRLAVWPLPGTAEVVEWVERVPRTLPKPVALMNPNITSPKPDKQNNIYTNTPNWQFCFIGTVELIPIANDDPQKQQRKNYALQLRERDGQMHLEDAAGYGCAYPWLRPLTHVLSEYTPNFDSNLGVLKVQKGPEALLAKQGAIQDELNDWVPNLLDVYDAALLPGNGPEWNLSLRIPRRLADAESARWAYLAEFCQRIAALPDPLHASQQWDALAAEVARHSAWKHLIEPPAREEVLRMLQQAIAHAQQNAAQQPTQSYYFYNRVPKAPALPLHLSRAWAIGHMPHDLTGLQLGSGIIPQEFDNVENAVKVATETVLFCVCDDARWLDDLLRQSAMRPSLRVYALFSRQAWNRWQWFYQSDPAWQFLKQGLVRITDDLKGLREGVWVDIDKPQPAFYWAGHSWFKRPAPTAQDWDHVLKQYLLAKPCPPERS